MEKEISIDFLKNYIDKKIKESKYKSEVNSSKMFIDYELGKINAYETVISMLERVSKDLDKE